MTETLRLFFTQFHDPAILVTLSLMAIVASILALYWSLNRRRFQKLSHQIPATVVKNYLDSIIENSNALKSSLFRGGGLDVQGGVPSVLPLRGPESSPAVAVNQSGDQEALQQKNALIASLQGQLDQKQGIVNDLEKRIRDLEDSSSRMVGQDDQSAELKEENDLLRQKIEDLNQKVAQAGEGAPSDDGRVAALEKERDEFRERLQEYEIIEDDLANLKRLQQENEELKKALKDSGAEVKEAPAEEAPAEEAPPAEETKAEETPKEESQEEPSAPTLEAPAAEEAPAEASAEAPAAEPAKSAEDVPEVDNEKSQEDLLSEFEKMLG